MLHAVEQALPADGVICAAAVADWQLATVPTEKMKKQGDDSLTLTFTPTVDILATIARHPTMRPALVVGFAAETHAVLEHAKEKRIRKGCDWIVATNVAGGAVFGAEDTDITLVTAKDILPFGQVNKYVAAEQLTIKLMEYFHGLT
jgi:phosphopantothenoylcysteine decarboxylase/phosphopantothenate--cysteine ligase